MRSIADPPHTDGVRGRPLTQQARDALLQAIRDDAFPGDRLPPEAELAVALGVSRTTLRAALQSLQADGLVSRRRRHGTFVNRHLLRSTMRLNRLEPFTVLIEHAGHEPSVDPQRRAVGAPSEESAALLGIGPDADCLVVERLLRATGRPVITVVDVVPLARLTVAPDAVVDADTTFDFVARNGAGTVDYTTAELIPRVGGAGAPEDLPIPDGVPYLEMLETHYTQDHEVIAISRVSVDDRLVRLSILRRDG